MNEKCIGFLFNMLVESCNTSSLEFKYFSKVFLFCKFGKFTKSLMIMSFEDQLTLTSLIKNFITLFLNTLLIFKILDRPLQTISRLLLFLKIYFFHSFNCSDFFILLYFELGKLFAVM